MLRGGSTSVALGLLAASALRHCSRPAQHHFAHSLSSREPRAAQHPSGKFRGPPLIRLRPALRQL